MRKQAPHFRRDETRYVMHRWQAGESCSLVGVGSVGKSNFLHHLTHPDTQQKYLGDEKADRLKVINVDPNLLGPISTESPDDFRAWAGYELLMHRLYLAFYPFEMLGEDAMHFHDTYDALRNGNNPLFKYMGLRYFELGLEFFLRRGYRVVFMFDEFEEMLRMMPPTFFLALRGLRDNNKAALMYLTFTRMPLPPLVEALEIDALRIEPFIELFTDNRYFIGAYNTTDSRDMLQRLMDRNKKAHPEHVIEFLQYASGGYSGILRAAFRSVEMVGKIHPNDIQNAGNVRRLSLRRAVQIECETIWNSLMPTEKRLLLHLPKLTDKDMTTETQAAIQLLVGKGILRADSVTGGVTVEPPVFRAYIEAKRTEQT